MIAKGTQSFRIRGYPVVVIVAAEHARQPFPYCRNGRVESVSQFSLQGLQLRRHALSFRVSPDGELPHQSLRTNMCESQESECFRLAFSTPCSVFRREAAEFQ